MNSENSSLNKFAHNLGQNWYHVVLIPKKRYPVFQNEIQRNVMNDAIDYVCKRHNLDLFTKEVMADHVHLFIDCPPHFSIRKMLQIIKGGTSFYMRSKLPRLKVYLSLWSRGAMYRSVGAVSAEIVKKYIDKSNVWDNSQTKLI